MIFTSSAFFNKDSENVTFLPHSLLHFFLVIHNFPEKKKEKRTDDTDLQTPYVLLVYTCSSLPYDNRGNILIHKEQRCFDPKF